MLTLLVKVTILFLAGLSALLIARRSTAAIRHLICACALGGSLLLPAAALLPSNAIGIRLQAIDAISVEPATTQITRWPATNLVLSLWLAGSTLLLIRLAIGYWRISRVLRAATPVGPSLFAAATLHERTHVQRKDLWVNFIACLACVTYWFHPLAWVLSSVLRDNQEKACDDAVLDTGFEPAAYAEALLAVAKSSTPNFLPGCSMTTQTNLKTRIARLLDRSIARNTSPLALRRTALIFAVLLLALTALSPAQQRTGKIYKLEGDVQIPHVIVRVNPDYTEEARDNKIQGTVLLSIVVGTDGLAHDVSIIRTLDPGLDRNAAEILQQWRFTPGTLHGEPVEVRATIEINYKLQ